MIRRNFFALRGLRFNSPDLGGSSGSPAPAPAEVVETHNGSDPDHDKPKDGETVKAEVAAAKAPDAPDANSTFAAPAVKNVVFENPHAQNKPAKVKMVRVQVAKLATYEQDGKHIAGDKVWVTPQRADELISAGYAQDLGESVEIEPKDVPAQIAKNDPPRV